MFLPTPPSSLNPPPPPCSLLIHPCVCPLAQPNLERTVPCVPHQPYGYDHGHVRICSYRCAFSCSWYTSVLWLAETLLFNLTAVPFPL